VQNSIDCAFLSILALGYAVLKRLSVMVLVHGLSLLILYGN
jgi:hypothetical protein